MAILNAPPLARALYHHVELNHEIPAPLYSAVAQVLAWVYQLRAWNQGQVPVPPPRPERLDIPEGLDPQAARAGAAA